MALSDGLLAVGARGDDTGGNDRGAAYLFSFDADTTYQNLVLQSKIAHGTTVGGTSLNFANNDNFGSSLALSDGLLAIGAFRDNTGGLDRGAAYLFSFDAGSTFQNLTLQTKLAHGSALSGATPSLSLSNSDTFGFSVAVSDGLLAVGGYGDDTGGDNRGAAYLFTFDPGTGYQNLALQTKLAHGSPLTGAFPSLSLSNSDEFGVSVAISDGLLAVGSAVDNTGGSLRGAAYLFSFSSGTPYQNLALQTKLAHGTPLAGATPSLSLADVDLFGISIGLTPSLLAVGAFQDDTGGNNRGAAYLFSFDPGTAYHNLTLQTKLADGSTIAGAPAGLSLSDNDQFGYSLALSPGLLALGAITDGTGGPNRGAAYLFNTSSLPQLYANGIGASVTIDPTTLTNVLNGGTNLILQASNDLTVRAAILAENLGGDGGSLTLQAGRSLSIEADITTDNGNLTLVANDLSANGVVDADRDPGAAGLAFSNGVTVDVGTAEFRAELRNGAGNSNMAAGNIFFGTSGSFSAASFMIFQPWQ